MLQNIKRLTGYSMGATDGEIGKVTDFFFDDEKWTIRYLVVDTGGWLFGRKVLISPHAISGSNRHAEMFPVDLTKEQVRNSPDIDTDKPVSRQHEIELYNYYPWPTYWAAGDGGMGMGLGMPGLGMVTPVPDASEQQTEEEAGVKKEKQDPHLRSMREVRGYAIHAVDGTIGEIEDYIIDDSTWRIVFLVVDTGNWFPGKKVLLSPQWIRQIQWERSQVIVDVTRDQVKNSPEYDPSMPMSESYRDTLHDYYGRKTEQ